MMENDTWWCLPTAFQPTPTLHLAYYSLLAAPLPTLGGGEWNDTFNHPLPSAPPPGTAAVAHRLPNFVTLLGTVLHCLNWEHYSLSSQLRNVWAEIRRRMQPASYCCRSSFFVLVGCQIFNSAQPTARNGKLTQYSFTSNSCGRTGVGKCL